MRKRDIAGKIRSTIRKSDKIDYMVSCFERRNEERFRLFAREQSTDTIVLEVPADCKRERKELVYYIRSGNPFSGFGAELRRTLDALFFADFYGFIPVVEYTHDYIYSERTKVNGVSNPYEYYFRQPAGVSVSQAGQSVHVFFREEHRELVRRLLHAPCTDSPYHLSEAYLRVLGKTAEKYLHLNAAQEEYMQRSFEEIELHQTRVIGVHYRGTDFQYGYKRHPKMLKLNDYYGAIDGLMDQSQEECRIFLATDEEKAIGLFKERYGDRVIYFPDAYRSENGEPVHFSKDSRRLHNYRLGMEILRDMTSLSRCDYLVSGLSQVSFCARIFKYSHDSEYMDKVILNNGIN